MKTVFLFCLVMCGCASLDIHAASGPKDEGLHFFRPQPYVLLSAGPTGCAMDIKYLPDYDNEYVMVVHSGFGSVAFNPTLDAGWNLTGLNATVDSKASEALATLGAVVGATLPSMAGKAVPKSGPTTDKSLHPGLYRLDLRRTGECHNSPASCFIPILVNETQGCVIATTQTSGQ